MRYVIKEDYSNEVVFTANRLTECEQWCADFAAAHNYGLLRCWELNHVLFRDCGPRVFRIETILD